MASTIEQIMAELDRTSGYASDRSILQNNLNQLPGQAKAQIAGLDAKLKSANDNILQGARSRGVGFSGIPIGEQAQYAATDYAPAVAGVRKSQNDQASTILSSLNSLSRDQRNQAQSIFDNNRNYELQREQLADARRASAAASGGGGGFSFGDGGLGAAASAAAPTPSGTQAQMSQRKGGGFNFSIGGKGVSAAAYAKATGQNFRTLLATMAKNGDSGARAALGFVGNDFKYDPKKLTAQNAALYNALTYGITANAKYKAPAKRTPSPIQRIQNAYGGVRA